MNVQSTSNGTIKVKTLHPQRRKARKVARRVRGELQHLSRGVTDFVQHQETRVAHALTGASGWIRRNPKTAIGVALGAGLFVGALANGRYGRAALVGLVGLIADRFA